MKKLNRRALSVMMISLFIILGLFTYIERFLRDGENWASYFSRLNSLSEGYVTDRNGVLLAAFTANDNSYNEDRNTRIANYHVTGDFWNRTGSGILTNFARQLHGYSPVTGMTQTKRISLKLNVDSVLDNKAYAALAGRKGAVGIVNYRTGELICMVSSPAVDPIESDPVAPEGVYINRLLSASFTPGSIFKLITAAAAIECVPTIWQRSFFCLGEEEISGVLFHCPFAHYTNDFRGALANSCNIAFAQIAISVGQREMVNHVRAYGFLDPHSLDGIPTAAGSYPLDFVGDPETAWSGIGQSTDLICPYSMLRFVAAIANDGPCCALSPPLPTTVFWLSPSSSTTASPRSNRSWSIRILPKPCRSSCATMSSRLMVTTAFPGWKSAERPVQPKSETGPTTHGSRVF